MTVSLGNARKPLGQILVDLKLLSEQALNEALMEQKLNGGTERLGALLLRRGLISAFDYVKALALQHQQVASIR